MQNTDYRIVPAGFVDDLTELVAAVRAALVAHADEDDPWADWTKHAAPSDLDNVLRAQEYHHEFAMRARERLMKAVTPFDDIEV